MLRQDILWSVENDYAGDPYYVSGNAILHAIANASDIPYETQRKLNVSHGMFCPSVYGVFPEWHSQGGGRMNFASTLKPIETYADLFLFRLPSHPWIHDGRPHEAVNVPAYRSLGGESVRPPTQSIQTTSDTPRKIQWYIHGYLMAPENSDVLPLSDDTLDNLQFGGYRNYGFGSVSLKETKVTDLSTLDYSGIENADEHILELVTPFVLESEYPKVNDVEIPGWWDRELTYRTRNETIIEQRQEYDMKVVDHGQVTKYYGRTPVETAKNGVSGIGSHSKYGYGEMSVRPTE